MPGVRFDHSAETSMAPQARAKISRRRAVIPAAAIMLAAACSWSAAIAAPPANDVCAQAIVVPGAGPYPYLSPVVDLADAGISGDPPAPSCQSSVSRSVWFAFTPAIDNEYTFSLCPEAPTATTVEDTVLAIYTSAGGCGGPFAQVAGGCDDDSCALTSLQSVIADIPIQAGTTYFIVAWKYSSTAPQANRSSVQLRVTQAPPPPPPPPNDQCAGAELLPGNGPFPLMSAVTPDVTGATSAGDPPPPTCQPNGRRSLWYAFTPAVSGGYEISTCADAPTGTTVDDTVV